MSFPQRDSLKNPVTTVIASKRSERGNLTRIRTMLQD